MNNDSNKFNYNYVAPTEQERSEVESIRRQYVEADSGEDGLVRLRKLDGKVKRAPTAVSIVLGVVGILVFGLGITMVLEWNSILWGVIVSVAGVIPLCLAYPVYKFMLKRNKDKYGCEIVQLADEILSDR